MILRFPDSYFFSNALNRYKGYEGCLRNDPDKCFNNENIDNNDIYSFKFTDDEYVNEMTI